MKKFLSVLSLLFILPLAILLLPKEKAHAGNPVTVNNLPITPTPTNTLTPINYATPAVTPVSISNPINPYWSFWCSGALTVTTSTPTTFGPYYLPFMYGGMMANQNGANYTIGTVYNSGVTQSAGVTISVEPYFGIQGFSYVGNYGPFNYPSSSPVSANPIFNWHSNNPQWNNVALVVATTPGPTATITPFVTDLCVGR
jgi:hypothetical protein